MNESARSVFFSLQFLKILETNCKHCIIDLRTLIDETAPFQRIVRIIYHEIPVNNFLIILVGLPFLLFIGLKTMQSTLFTCASNDILYTYSNYVDQFSIIFSSVGAIPMRELILRSPFALK